MTRRSAREAVVRVVRDQIEAGIRAARPIADQRAADRVTLAAMRWYLRPAGGVNYPLNAKPGCRCDECGLLRACAALAKKGTKR